MKHEIRFKGLSLDRDELAAQHGELALCGGVELHDGALRPSIMDGTQLGGGSELYGTLLYVHINVSYKHYITYDSTDGSLRWAEEVTNNNVTSWSEHAISGLSGLVLSELSITSIGNTLCVMASTGLHYILFKETTYKYLGQQPPFLELQFNMVRQQGSGGSRYDTVKQEIKFSNTSGGGFISKENGDAWIDYDDSQTGSGGWKILEDFQGGITEGVMAAVNQLISENSDRNLFHAPFLIRYCYRMYDGTSLIFHSPPVLLMPPYLVGTEKINEVSADVRDFHRSPIVGSRNMYYNFASSFTCDVSILTAKLEAKCLNPSVYDDLEDWGDIIKSLDIFITPQLSRINASGAITFIHNGQWGGLGTGLLNGSWGTYRADSHAHDDETFHFYQGSLKVPMCSPEEYYDKVRNASTFFKLGSFKTELLRNTFQDSFSEVSIEDGVLKDISVQEQMKDDYKTHNILLPIESGKGGMYVYNRRLNVFGISEKLFEGFSPGVLFPYMSSSSNITKVIINLKTEDGLKKVEKTCSVPYITDALAAYVFYPDPRAESIIFKYGDDDNDKRPYQLNEHLSLNGAFYAFGSYKNFSANDGNDIVPMPSKIYTSKVDNPYYFPNLVGESGINFVGTGTILGLAVVTRALSPSQVGDHDLIIFSTDGIWVGKVSSTGTYSSLHNISNEVCVNPKSICQLGQSVIFATNRAVNRFFESDMISISDSLNGPIKNFGTMMPEFYGLFYPTGDDATKINMKKMLDFNNGDIRYFKNVKIIYDYEANRLLMLPESVSNTATNVILVYSITDQTWSTMIIPPTRTMIPGYPCPYFQDHNGKVYCLDVPYPQVNEQTPVYSPGLIITRTLAFSETQDVIQGFQQLCDCNSIPLMYIYGSNDQRSWVNIGYSNRPYANYLPGHPYRYFRIAMYLTMAKTERYQELILDVINKYAKL
jgi:hypothetical protein